MRLHRFYVGNDTELDNKFWLHDERLLNQWLRVLRYQAGDEIILFDGLREDRLYRFTQLDPKSAHLELVTEMVRNVPGREVYLMWSMLKKDKNEWVIQKGTELGVSHFVPLLTEHTEKTGFDEDRALKVAIEAAEQCGRSDIPSIRGPIDLHEALHEYSPKAKLYVAEWQEAATELDDDDTAAVGVIIGPEGGWSDAEKELFKVQNMTHLNLGGFTLRAETAAITAAARFLS